MGGVQFLFFVPNRANEMFLTLKIIAVSEKSLHAISIPNPCRKSIFNNPFFSKTTILHEAFVNMSFVEFLYSFLNYFQTLDQINTIGSI